MDVFGLDELTPLEMPMNCSENVEPDFVMVQAG